MSKRNENRPGYKKTTVGWIPEEWDVQPLGSVTKKSQYGLSASSSVAGRTPLLRMGNIEDGKVTYKNLAYVDISDEERTDYRVQEDDLLFNRTNSLDHVGKLGIVTNPKPAVFASYLVRFQLKKTLAHPAFVAYFFNTHESRNRLKRLATPGVCQHNINQSELKKHFVIPLPSFPKQKKIAEILSTWDEAIDQTRGPIDAKKRRKKALMQQLLTGKKRLPGFRKSWEEYHLGDVFNERREINGHHLPLLAITGSRGVIPASEIKRKDSSNPDKSRYKIIRRGDIGYNTMRMWQGVSAVSGLDGIVSPAYTICVPKADVDVQFMGYFFKFPPVVHLFWRYSQGLVSDTLNLKFNNFAQIKVTIPNPKEQCAIAKVLSSADDEIATLEKKLTAFEKQKRGLMQKLLTGEVQVKT